MKYLKEEFVDSPLWKNQMAKYIEKFKNNKHRYSQEFYNYYINKGFHDCTFEALEIHNINDKFNVDLYLINNLNNNDRIKLQFEDVVEFNNNINFNQRMIFYDYIYDEFLVTNDNLSYEVRLIDYPSNNYIKIIYNKLNFKIL